MRVCVVTPIDLFIQENYPNPWIGALKEIYPLKKAGYKISVISWIRYHKALPEFEIKEGMEIHRVFLYPSKRNLLKRILFYFRLTKTIMAKIKEINPDVIICHDLELLNACVKAKKKLRVPLLYDSHDDCPLVISQNSKLEGKIFYLLERKLLRNVDHVITLSETLGDKFRKWKKPVAIFYNARPSSQIPIEKTDAREKIGLSKDDFVVGYTGWLHPKRGVKETIGSLKLLPENVKFLIVGGPDNAVKEYEKYAEDLEIRGRVKLIGRVPYDDVLKYTSVFDVGIALLPPEPLFFETLPDKVFDYIAVGIPLVVSDYPAMREVIEYAKCGVTVKSNRREDIAEAVLFLLNHPDKAKEMGENGRRAYYERYMWEKQEEKFMNTFVTCVKQFKST
ncbi:MAG: glycosyltransferase family 4 protein [Nanoarchaeota archaeon]|nr:glycosyltransferase family 4 protein [Nanoarchaeota archaeon]MCG2718659.1 glycosyltransferase family 4 protein [Nanoarchaeota archaeon]